MNKAQEPECYVEKDVNGRFILYGMKFTKKWKKVKELVLKKEYKENKN
jgi:hypothetical protein